MLSINSLSLSLTVPGQPKQPETMMMMAAAAAAATYLLPAFFFLFSYHSPASSI
jgi:hypothetical protein